MSSRRLRVIAFLIALITLAVGSGCRGGPRSFLDELHDARRLTADLRVQFSKATDASNHAVMADTDEASIELARSAEQAIRAVETELAALAPLLKSLGYPKEIQALTQFQKQFEDYQKLDRTILELAVENTNLKAQRLSFGPARAAADDFRTSVQGIVLATPAKDRCRADDLANKAVLAVRELQVIQAPHIAERDDAAMTRMEQEMTGLQATARAALGELLELVPTNDRAPLSAAGTALDRFDGVTAQLVALSRRNSNVRSLDLALRVKPPLTAACDDSLRALESALAQELSKPAR
jgi:hypothetical protein